MSTGQSSVDHAISTFKSETRRRWFRFVGSAALVAAALACASIGLACKGLGLPGAMPWFLVSLVAILGAALCTSRMGGETRTTQDIQDARAAGALFERLDVSFGAERRLVAARLIDLLHRVEATDAVHFGRAERDRMNEALRITSFAPDADLVVAILFAYERVGDERCLPTVEALALSTGETEAECKVRDAARTCIAEVRVRIQQLRTSAELLRASDASAHSGTLLRAAREPRDTPASELLRAESRE